MTHVARALAVLLLAASARAGEDAPHAARPALPGILTRLGFGDATHPVRVTYVGPALGGAPVPTLVGTRESTPPNTLWHFDDPRPVWEVLARARTRRYLDGTFPAAAARLVIDASEGTIRRQIHLHFRAGDGDISLRRGEGPFLGGMWNFAPEADAALVALLSRTPPYAIGASPAKVFQLYRPVPQAARRPHLLTFTDPETFADAQATLQQRYGRTGDWILPEGFDWRTHFLILVELPPGPERKRLDWSGARVRDGVLAWELSARPEDAPAVPAGSAPGLLGAFRRIAGLRHVRADFASGTQSELRWLAADDDHIAQPPGVFLRVVQPHDTTELPPVRRTVEVCWDRAYVVQGAAGRWYGHIPIPLSAELGQAFGMRPYPLDEHGRPPATREYVLTPAEAGGGARDPAATAVAHLLAYLDRAHAP